MGLLLFCIVFSSPAYASASGPVIKRFQAGGAASGTSQQEYIEIYNDSLQDVDITNWCLYYNDLSQVSCFSPPDAGTKLFLSAKSFVLVVSPQLLATNPTMTYDFTYKSGFTTNIPGTNGTLSLVDSLTSLVVDRLGWGNGVGEGVSMSGNLPGGQIFERIQDTGNNSIDFTVKSSPALLQSGGVYEQAVPIDVCPNTLAIDSVVPVGYMQDADGNCYEDVCDNITGLQKVVSSGYYRSGIDCHIVQLKINEVLPNASGSDTGKEFIEIYNPTNYAVSLGGYQLQLGPSYSKNYPLPSVSLDSGEYVALLDSQTGITLPNSSASIKLLTPDGQTVDETDVYQDPGDDQAWAVFGGVWQYTNQPTSGFLNKEPVASGYGSGTTSLKSCPAGKYRNLETNRCRNINSGTSNLKPCRADQIRNPATNRCRSIFSASSGLKPCKVGQTRNPETNRCRKTTSGSGLKACAVNQVRNPETNRCRKKTSSEIAASEIKDIESKIQADHGGWLLAGTAGVGLAGYGVAEWRQEITLGLRRIRALLGKNPPDY